MNSAGEQGKKIRKSVVVLYNQVGDDWYETLKHIDPDKLPFKPEYPIHVATVKEEYEEVAKALKRAGYRARAVNLKDDLRILERVLKRNRPELVFNLVEGFHDDPELEAMIAGMFDLYRIRYTGSPPFALALCMDKGFTKQVLQTHGVPTPRYKLFQHAKLPKRLGLEYPLIVKPAWEDASAGIDKNSVVHDEQQLLQQLEQLLEEYDPPMMVEEFIAGRELHVSVWGNDKPEILPPVEFDFSKLPPGYPPVISYEMKWNPLDELYHRVHTICPAQLEPQVLRRVAKVAIQAYEATWCRDYARLDIRLKGDKPYVLEVNPNPDLTEGVSFMDSAEAAGISFDQALARIAELALAHHLTPMPTPETKAEVIADLNSLGVGAFRLRPPDPAVTRHLTDGVDALTGWSFRPIGSQGGGER